MIDITKGQKKILIFTGIGVAVFIAFWMLIYRPASGKVKDYKKDLLEIEAKISATKAIIGDKPLEEGIKVMREQLKELDERLPETEEGTLQMISGAAYSSGVSVKSTKPQGRSKFHDSAKKTVEIESKFCHRIPISLAISSTYKELGRFLEGLKTEVPSISTMEKLTVSRQSDGRKLNADIELTIYLLCE